MLVSDSMLNYTDIIEFPVETRFLKLPIQKLFEVQGLDPIGPQIAMINAINDPRIRFVVACLSRRTGKTFCANYIAFLKAMEPNVKVLIISPNYSLSNISWSEQLGLIKRHNIKMLKANAKDKEILLENGSLIKLGSIAQVDSCVGRSYDLILFDEAALDDKGKDAFNIQLRPTLDKENSKAIFISTPRGDNYFKGFYDRGFDRTEFPDWISIHSTWRDNPRAKESDIDAARKSMSSAEFRQEYEADFAVFEGQIYDGFDPEIHVMDLSDMDMNLPNFETLMGIDAGYKDATSAVVVKYDMDEDLFYIRQDYEVAGVTTEQHARVFEKMMGSWDVDLIFVDAAAAQFRQDLVIMFDIPSAPAKKSVLDGIAYVQTLIEQNKIIVDSSCHYIIEMLRNYRWDQNDNLLKPKPVHNGYSHSADALRYALYSYTR